MSSRRTFPFCIATILAVVQVVLALPALAAPPTLAAPPKVVITTSSEPVVFKPLPEKIYLPRDRPWLIPFRVDTTDSTGDTTFGAVRHMDPGGGPMTLSIAYFDPTFNVITSGVFPLEENQVFPINVRDIVSGIDDPPAILEGILQIDPSADAAVDFFQVDASQNAATGSVGWNLEDFCRRWMVRFLRFPGLDGGTELTFFVDQPFTLTPSVEGNIYSQSGEFVNSFTIITPVNLFTIEATELLEAGQSANFGSIELEINTMAPPAGVLTATHRAFDRFSVGLPAFCLDPRDF